MEAFYTSIHYWLVEHPAISQFEWKQGHTFGTSLLFITLSVSIYLSLTLLSILFSKHLPSLSTTTTHRITAIHSLILCLLSVIMVIGCSLSLLHQIQMPPHDLKWIVCLPAKESVANGPVFFWIHVCYLSKILEFVDTLLIILSSSRSRRLSFLHVYHHVMVPVLAYIGLYVKGSLLGLAVIINGSVHVLMYAYYFLSAIGKRPWWKRAVTNCQIMQFVFGFPLSGMTLYYHFTTEYGCTGIGLWGLGFGFNASLLALFLDFHSKNYANNIKLQKHE